MNAWPFFIIALLGMFSIRSSGQVATVCGSELEDSPMIRRLKLGMSSNSVTRIIGINDVAQIKHTIIWVKREGDRYVIYSPLPSVADMFSKSTASVRRRREFDRSKRLVLAGESSLKVEKIASQKRPHRFLANVRSVDAKFFEDRLFSLAIFYDLWDSPKWIGVGEFVESLSLNLGLQRGHWKATLFDSTMIYQCPDWYLNASIIAGSASISLVNTKIEKDLPVLALKLYNESERQKELENLRRKKEFRP